MKIQSQFQVEKRLFISIPLYKNECKLVFLYNANEHKIKPNRSAQEPKIFTKYQMHRNQNLDGGTEELQFNKKQKSTNDRNCSNTKISF